MTIKSTIKGTGFGSVWEDLRVSPSATTAQGSKDPGYAEFKDNGAGSQGVFAYHFDASAEEELYFDVQLPHAWDGSVISPHVHWTPKITSDGNPANQKVSWGLEYTWANIGETFGNTGLVYTVTDFPADGNIVAGKHYMSTFADIVPTASQNGISSILMCRIFRNATDVVNDTYEQDAVLLSVDFHYPLNSMGSEYRGVK